MATLSFPVEARGFGAVLVDTKRPSTILRTLLANNRAVAAEPVLPTDSQWKPLPQRMVPISATRRTAFAPDGMVRIPGGKFRFKVGGIEIEKSEGVDVQYPWEDSPRLDHDHAMDVKPFFIDRLPVTNAAFKRFVDATRYRPADDHNFLRDWKNGTYPEGWAEKPVTWVSLEDARAYAKWAGKRLPHEWEWQLAAQGTDGRIYPWGSTWDDAAVPPPDTTRTRRPPTDAGAYPRGASPYGVLDLVGNVWQWTDEFQDAHTRTAVLRGGSYYRPQGSGWYFPQAYRLDQHGKYLLMVPSKDRAGTVGFRCVADAAPEGKRG
jgi:formylglycine-generating enzyme required for sulfatase activity